jgi:fimbrial chaperone protein
MTRLAAFALACLLFIPGAAFAKNAEIMLLPTRVVMEKADRQGTIVIKNTGDATGNFTIELVDMKMLETGIVVPYDTGEEAQFSATKLIHIAPKSMTLKAGETQNVRLLLRKPETLEPGEYRTHLRVRLVDENADQKQDPSQQANIQVKANLVIVIPIIVRHGATSLAMNIDSPRIARDTKGNPSLEMYLAREGNRSSMGDITVSCGQQVIKVFQGVAVYRPTTRRFVSVPLDETPKGVDPSSCPLGISYVAQQKEGGGKLAETQLKR